MALSNFATYDIETYFGSGPYYVPDYQRDYAWEDNLEVKDYFDDLMTVRDNEMKDYFIGQIVVHNSEKEGKKYLIDGQQRTVTSFLLLIVLRGFFQSIEADAAADVSSKSTAHKRVNKIESILEIIDKDDDCEKLWLGVSDRKYFRDTFAYGDLADIIGLKERSEKTPSRKKMIKCCKYFYKRITSDIEDLSYDAKTRFLDAIYKTLIKSFKVLYVETTSEDEALIIFETLNGRGRELATSDLLKNYLFRKVGEKKRDEIKANWNSMAKRLDGSKITLYVRYLWNSSHVSCREKMLYRTMTDKTNGITTPAACLDFSESLAKYAPVFMALSQPEEHAALCFDDKEVIQKLIDLNRLKVQTFYPVILAMKVLDYKDEEIRDVLHAIECLIVRDIVIGENNPNSSEKDFSKIAHQISTMELLGSDDISAAIKDACELKDDAGFINVFSQYRGKNTPSGKEKIRFILRKLENESRQETEIVDDNNKVHIEHIMPISNKYWNVPEAEHEAFLWRLGNLTFLLSDLNQEIKNAVFSAKKAAYAASDIYMTRELTAYEQWRTDYTVDGKTVAGEITKRQEELARKAATLWKF